MQASQTPTLVPLAFAANGTKNTIPEASQIGITNGAASLNDGFPPLTFTPVAAGGVPPSGADFNGVLNLLSASIRWAHGGGRYGFSSTFAADANVSGYPSGAELMSADLQGAWLSLNDSNTDNPDTGAGTKWVPSRAYGITSLTGLTNANVTLTPAQAAKNRITLAGTLTANVQIIFPVWLRDWVIVNNTTGAFAVTCKTSAGTGVAIPQDGSPTKITGDGTNITQPAENVAAGSAATHAAQLGQLTGAIGSRTNLKGSCVAGATTITLSFDSLVVGTSLTGLQYLLSGSSTLNLATTGAGGMDTGTATASTWLAVYEIYNPTTGAKAAYGTIEGASAAPTVYSGTTGLPPGYTASTLMTVLKVSTTAGQLQAHVVNNRRVSLAGSLVYNTSTTTSTATAIAMTGAVPKCATSARGYVVAASTASSAVGISFFSDSAGTVGTQNVSLSSGTALTGNYQIDLFTAQTIYYTNTNSAGTPTYSFYANAFEF